MCTVVELVKNSRPKVIVLMEEDTSMGKSDVQNARYS